MRFGITSHGLIPTPPSLQPRRPLDQRAMTAPPTSLPTRGALNSRGAPLDPETVIPGQSEAYHQLGSSAASFREPRDRETGEEQAPSQQRERVSRTRSVQFSNPAARMATSSGEARSGEGEERDGRYAAAESSGDEITPMFPRERGAVKGYDATATTNSKLGTDVGASSQDNTARKGTKKRRRSMKGKRSDGGAEAAEEEQEEDEGGWWARTIEKFGGVELDNKGSVARDHLALGVYRFILLGFDRILAPNIQFYSHLSSLSFQSLPEKTSAKLVCPRAERTFLAWLRTSLAFASIGIAITQLFRLNTTISEREGLKPNKPDNTYHLRQLGKPLGATFLGIAILVLAIGGRRYFESQVCPP